MNEYNASVICFLADTNSLNYVF